MEWRKDEFKEMDPPMITLQVYDAFYSRVITIALYDVYVYPRVYHNP